MSSTNSPSGQGSQVHNGAASGQPTRDGESERLRRFYSAREMTANLMMMRDELASFLTDRRRNIAEECGYPTHYDVRLYQLMFDTEAIANRVVSVLPDECSLVQPRIYESERDTVTTGFEKSYQNLDLGLQGEDNYCFDEEGSALAEVFARADLNCGIGRYGITLVGTDGDPDYARPLAFSKPGKRIERKLLHLSCYPEYLATVSSFDEDRSSVRYGQPETYQINFDSTSASSFGPSVSFLGTSVSTMGLAGQSTVHWTRVVHHVDNPISSTIFGVPRQQPVMRRLLDLQKAYAATGEAIWQVGVPGFSVESDPSLGGEVDYDPAALRQSVERYMNGFQRWMLSNGFVIKSLSPNIADFTPHMASLLEAICIQLGIPMRVFRGSEVGERASLEDAKRWRVKVQARRRKHVSPRVLRPLINRFISLGVLDPPGKKGFHIWWPDVETNTPDEQANIALKSAQALDFYSRANAMSVMTPYDFFVSQMGKSETDARRFVDDAEKLAEERRKLAEQQAAASAASAGAAGGVAGQQGAGASGGQGQGAGSSGAVAGGKPAAGSPGSGTGTPTGIGVPAVGGGSSTVARNAVSPLDQVFGG